MNNNISFSQYNHESWFKLFIAIIFLTSLGQIMSDLYIPAIPSMVTHFYSNVGKIQQTIAYFYISYSLSQIVYGYLADFLGRKRMILIGLCICFIANIICLTTNNINFFLLGRFAQGMGAGVGLSISRTLIRDISIGKKLFVLSSYRSVANIFFVILAPLIGGYLTAYLGWRSNFLFLFFYTIFILVWIILFLPETNDKTNQNYYFFKAILKFSKNLNFLGCCFCAFFTYAGVISWLTMGSIILQIKNGFSVIEFSWIILIMGLFFGIGGIINAKLILRYELYKIIRLGLSLMFLSGTIILILSLTNFLYSYFFILFTAIFVFSLSFLSSNYYAKAVESIKSNIGFANSLFCAIQTIGGFVSSFIIANFLQSSALTLGFIFVFCSIAILIIDNLFVNEPAFSKI